MPRTTKLLATRAKKDFAKQIEAIAAERGMSVSELVGSALKAFVSGVVKAAKDPAIRKRIDALKGAALSDDDALLGEALEDIAAPKSKAARARLARLDPARQVKILSGADPRVLHDPEVDRAIVVSGDRDAAVLLERIRKESGKRSRRGGV